MVWFQSTAINLAESSPYNHKHATCVEHPSAQYQGKVFAGPRNVCITISVLLTPSMTTYVHKCFLTSCLLLTLHEFLIKFWVQT